MSDFGVIIDIVVKVQIAAIQILPVTPVNEVMYDVEWVSNVLTMATHALTLVEKGRDLFRRGGVGGRDGDEEDDEHGAYRVQEFRQEI
ncbi:glycoside hydrolase family 81 [Fusarium napiforme]|uniref:Glycoside hydrolase family 81 n=1 Tax=Fusarium napiforme TaxID=42672 RepID=A0A8H5N4T6_9HYPO|nr:glycoside hydrolase family 81 [Fusarium napiforme]